jgi:hypothetical protein
MTDVKIVGGNNRQCDLLAFNLATQEQYHVESSVTHALNFLPSDNELQEVFDRKFRGLPAKREGIGTDYSKGKSYSENILNTYRRVGFDPAKIQRVFVTWVVKDDSTLKNFLSNYARNHGIEVQVFAFRDQILPELMEKISTSNYDDEVLRTLSLIRQKDMQKKREK